MSSTRSPSANENAHSHPARRPEAQGNKCPQDKGRETREAELAQQKMFYRKGRG